jgi:hypothetical protein
VGGCIRAEAYHHDWLLASCYWPLATDFKILGMNRGLGNLGDYKRKLATPNQGQETSSQKPGASSQERNATLCLALLYAVTFDFFHQSGSVQLK